MLMDLKECAVVTHYRLKNNPDGNGVIVDPESEIRGGSWCSSYFRNYYLGYL